MTSPFRSCGHCGFLSEKLLTCSRCRCAYYCSSEHQKADWTKHKATCVPGTSVKFDKSTGAPKHATPPLDIKGGQQELNRERSNTYFSAMAGTFDVILKGTIVEGNDIPDGSNLIVRWTHENTGQTGEDQVLFLSPASLAMELFSCSLGHADNHYKYLEGGFLDLIGEPHLFWSLAIHRRVTGLCFPPQPPFHTTWSWDTTWASKELERITCKLPVNDFLGSPSIGIKTKLKGKSRSMAAVEIVGRNKEFIDKVLPCFSSSTAMSSNLPGWWVSCERFWGEILTRQFTNYPSKAPCMFYCTPMGCKAGAECICYHDIQTKDAVEKVKAQNSRSNRH